MPPRTPVPESSPVESADLRPRRGTGAGAGLVLGVSLLVAGCGRGGEGAGQDRPARPRNAILISIDTLRPDYLSCYGHARPTSPNLDAVARNGVRFTDVTAAAPWTLPSHATMFTGLYPAHHGVKSHETRLPESIQTLAEELRDGGFSTMAVVNTHNIGAPQFQLQQGFQRFSYVQELVEDSRMRMRTPNGGENVIAEAKEFLAQREAEKPFFLFLHFYDVHTDFTPRDEFKQRFVEPYAGKLDGRSQQLDGVRKRGEVLSAADLAFLHQMYEAEIAQLDELLGRFFAWLAEQHLADDTLIVITSDHGEEFQEHGGLLHGRTQYQEVMRVPLFLAGPGIPAGVVVDTPVNGVDLTPTLLAALGVRSSQPRDGLDLAPGWSGGTLPARTFFAEADHNNRIAGKTVSDIKKMVRQGEAKLLYDTHTQKAELYDLAADPDERTDLAATAPERAAALRAELERYLAGAIQAQAIAAPTEEEQRKLDALGYGGGDDKAAPEPEKAPKDTPSEDPPKGEK